METPEIFISKTVHNTVSLYVSKTYYAREVELKDFAFQTMDRLCVWHTNIVDSHTGWEFSKEFTPETIQLIFKRLTGVIVEIL